VAISNKSIIILSTIGFGLLGFVLYFFILRHTTNNELRDGDEQQREAYGEMLDRTDGATLNRAQRRAKAKFRMKKARCAQVMPVGGRQQQQQQAEEGVDGNAAPAHGNVGNNVAENNNNDAPAAMETTNLSRKDRQRIARAMEQKERKLMAEEARKWREKNKTQSTTSDGGSKTMESSHNEESQPQLSLEDVFPRRMSKNDMLSGILFWESITKNIKDKNSHDETILSKAQQLPKMTIREFINQLKENGSVSIAALADEFGISVEQALMELENINKQHGIVGVIDAKGNFLYVSMEMINKAIEVGLDAVRVSLPRVTG